MAALIAIFLFFASLFLLYAGLRYRAARGRISERQQARDAGQTKDSGTPEDTAQEQWGVSRDAYCYPKINDMMGYDFVKVVNVDKSLRPDVPVPEVKENPQQETDEGQERTGTVRIASEEEAGPDSGNRIERMPDEDDYDPRPAADTESEDDETATKVEMSAEEFAAMNSAFNAWPSNDNDYDEAAWEEMIDKSLQENPDLIDDSEDEDDDGGGVSIEKEKEEISRYALGESILAGHSATQSPDEASQILDEL